MYSHLEKTKIYNGLSLTIKDVDWIQEYRVPPKAPVYGPQSKMYDNIKMFKPKYI